MNKLVLAAKHLLWRAPEATWVAPSERSCDMTPEAPGTHDPKQTRTDPRMQHKEPKERTPSDKSSWSTAGLLDLSNQGLEEATQFNQCQKEGKLGQDTVEHVKEGPALNMSYLVQSRRNQGNSGQTLTSVELSVQSFSMSLGVQRT